MARIRIPLFTFVFKLHNSGQKIYVEQNLFRTAIDQAFVALVIPKHARFSTWCKYMRVFIPFIILLQAKTPPSCIQCIQCMSLFCIQHPVILSHIFYFRFKRFGFSPKRYNFLYPAQKIWVEIVKKFRHKNSFNMFLNLLKPLCWLSLKY